METGGDVNVLQGEVSTEIEAINDFPDDVEDAVIRQLGTTEIVMVLLAAGPMSPGDLNVYCEQLKDRIQDLPDASLVTLDGFSDRQFRVALSREKLRRHGLTVQKVADILSRQSVNLPAGVIETDNDDLLLRFVEERKSAAELEQTGRMADELL
jgi:multidrug efflux pump subunit AcrB